nr:hypothetical protein GCM10020093_065770 [Planobispora longispora]
MDDDSRFEAFVAERADALLRYGYVLSGNPHDAADLTQEALIRLHRAWPRVRRKHEPESYVRTTMARLHVSTWRLHRRERLVWDPPEGSHLDALPPASNRSCGRPSRPCPASSGPYSSCATTSN